MTEVELLAKIKAAEKSLARCGDSFLQRNLRASITYWRQLLAAKTN